MPRARISTASIAGCGSGAANSPHYAHYRRRWPPPATKQALSGLACQAALRLVPPGPWAQCRIAWSVRFCRPGRCILIVEEATMLLLAAVCATMAKTCGGVPNTSSHTLDVPASMTHSGDFDLYGHMLQQRVWRGFRIVPAPYALDNGIYGACRQIDHARPHRSLVKSRPAAPCSAASALELVDETTLRPICLQKPPGSAEPSVGVRQNERDQRRSV